MKHKNPQVIRSFARISSAFALYGIFFRFVNEVKDTKRRLLDEKREITTSITGNILSFQRFGSSNPSKTIVIDAGFFASSLSCKHIAQSLTKGIDNSEVIIYDRAGYGSSIRSHYAPWSFNEAALDLQRVSREARGDSLWLYGAFPGRACRS